MLTILIPSYNHAPYIEEAIESARRIDLPNKRIVIIDDASTDDSVEVIERHLSRRGSDGIDFIAKPVNRGVIDTVHMFLEMSSTEYVYFMASDDIALSGGIETLVAALERDSAPQFAIGGGRNVFPNGHSTPIYGLHHAAFFALPPNKMRRALFLDCPSPILCQSSVFRLHAIKLVGGFDRNMIADDYALFTKLFLRYGAAGRDFLYMPDVPCVQYRHHAGSSHRNLPRQALMTKQVLETLTPVDLRARAIGEKLAYYALVAVFRRDMAGARRIVSMVPAFSAPWFAAGLFIQSAKKLMR